MNMSTWFRRALAFGGVFVAGLVVGVVVVVVPVWVIGFWTLGVKVEKVFTDVTEFFSEGDGDPAYGPGRIAFHSQHDGDWEIYVANADGSGLEQLTDNDDDRLLACVVAGR